MITPRRTRLVRVPDLRGFRRAIGLLTSEAPRDLFHSSAVVVPTRASARELARLHGGDLRLVRSENDWTEFEVRFPAANGVNAVA